MLSSFRLREAVPQRSDRLADGSQMQAFARSSAATHYEPCSLNRIKDGGIALAGDSLTAMVAISPPVDSVMKVSVVMR